MASPVYDAPMALDQTVSRTHGLEPPRRAKSRNKHHVQDSRKYTIGPIPAINFINELLPERSFTDRDAMLSSENAFRTAPESARSVSEISEPLV